MNYRIDGLIRLLSLAALSVAPAVNAQEGEYGTIPATFAVDQFGQAAYSMPIDAPVGPGGVRPDISLQYRSRAGDGPLGLGWVIGGMSQITRCPHTVAQDGAPRPVRYDADDRFCLDGQRLIAISGQYGAAGSQYKTEIDGFRKIVAYGQAGDGPAFFAVTDPDGTAHWYGEWLNSSLVDPVTGSNRFWRRYLVSDANGNAVRFTYEKDDVTGEHRLDYVDYTYRPTAPILSPQYRIDFVYEGKPVAHQRTGFQWGAPWALLERLETVNVQRLNGAWQTIYSYNLTYLPEASSLSHSLLERVQKCGPTECFNGSFFKWADGQIDLTGYSGTAKTTAATTVSNINTVGDFNGDGRDDIASQYFTGTGQNPSDYGVAIYYASASGQLDPPVTYPIGHCGTLQAIEFNGDGRADLLCVDDWDWYSLSITHLLVYESTDTGLVYQGTFASPAFHHAADIDGDGLTDLVYAEEQFVNSWKARINTTAGYAPAEIVGSFSNVTMRRAVWANFDDDLALEAVQPNSTDVLEYDPSSGTLVSNFSGGTGWHSYGLAAPDINGDGLADVVAGRADNGKIQTFINEGTSASLPTATNLPAGLLSFAVFDDVDNDGLTDMILPTGPSGAWQVHYSNGTSFSAGTGGSWSDASTLYTADVTGDGRSEVVYLVNGNTWNQYDHLGELEAVTKFWDGLGNWQELNYGLLSTMADHYKWATATYPSRKFRGPVHVVDHYVANTGTNITDYTYATGVVGDTFTMDYKYWDAMVDSQGRGFLGFSWVYTADSRHATAGYAVTRNMRQDFPFVGREESGHYFYAPCCPNPYTKSTDPAWADTPTTYPTGTVHFVRAETETLKEYEVGGPSAGQLVRTIVRDPTYETTYGRIDEETMTVTAYSGETYTTTVDYTLLNLTSPKYCVGLPDAISVTRSGTGMIAKTRTVDNTFDSNTCTLTDTTNLSEADPAKRLFQDLTYDGHGNITHIRLDSANGTADDRLTEIVYDSSGHLPTSVIQYVDGEIDHTTGMSWDYDYIVPLTITDVGGLTTSRQYDEFGRIDREDRPDGTYTRWIRGLCTTCIGTYDGLYFDYEVPSNGIPVVHYFNTMGQLSTRAANAVGYWEFLWRDSLGRVVERVNPNDSQYSTVYNYDLLDRIVQEDHPIDEAQPSGASTQWAYNRLVTTVTNAEGQTTTTGVDAIGRIVSVTDSMSGLTAYEYNAFNQLTKTTDAELNVTTIEYNNRGDRTRLIDPDMGTWDYDHTVFGETKSQTDAKSQVITFDYDQLGRLWRRSEPDFPSQYTTWSFYNTGDYRHGLPEAEIAPATDGYRRDYVYDSLSRLSQETVRIDGVNYTTDLTYHTVAGSSLGKLQRITYPTSTAGVRAKADYEYDTYGVLQRVKDGDTAAIYYEVNAYDAFLREIQATLGNGIVETRDYDQANGFLESIQAGSSATVQDFSYAWDKLGNLRQRIDGITGRTDDYTYDALNRLDTQTLNTVQILDMGYDSIGNIEQMTATLGASNYWYGAGAGGPHAVTSITGAMSDTYDYDANGNMIDRDGETITWYAYNNPKRIDNGVNSSEFWYGTDRARYKQVAVQGGSTVTTRYIGAHFEIEDRTSLIIYRHYIRAGDQTIAQYERRTDGTNPVHYLHRDHQGSVVATTDAAAGIRQRWEYDAFGYRWQTAGSQPNDTDRGYTGHEHLDSVELIHMNGRVQDPVIGRFISADPFVSAPFSSQSLNRYSYVRNNPLSLVDPSGFQDDMPDDNRRRPSGSLRECWHGPAGRCAHLEGIDLQDYFDGFFFSSSFYYTPVSTKLDEHFGYAEHAVTHVMPIRLPAPSSDVPSLDRPMAPPPERSWLEQADPLFCGCGYDFDFDNLVNSLPALGPAGVAAAEAGAIVGSVRAARGVYAGQAGAFRSLRGVAGDGLTAHHIPQAAARWTGYSEGGALVVTQAEHILTRTYGARGVQTLVSDAGLAFRQVLAKDIRDIRRIVGTKYNEGLRALTEYYRTHFPELMAK